MARLAPYAKFWCSLVTVVLLAVTVPLGSPAWIPVAVAGLNALAVFFTPNYRGEYEYQETEKPSDTKPKG
jgi:hypothetical protein